MRYALVIVLALVVAGSAFGQAERLHSLRAVEKAFYDAHIPFSTDWRSTRVNPYLVPKPSSPRAALGPRFRRHLIGWAGTVNNKTFRGGEIWIFDGEAIARSYGNWQRAHCAPRPSCSRSILRANNVVYAGSMSPRVVRAAMARLRHE